MATEQQQQKYALKKLILKVSLSTLFFITTSSAEAWALISRIRLTQNIRLDLGHERT